jgi:hypothetical protein
MKVNPEHYKKETIVVCILNSRASLTIGKEYLVENVDIYKDNVSLYITNDEGYKYEYEALRFVPKSDFRQHLINQILD